MMSKPTQISCILFGDGLGIDAGPGLGTNAGLDGVAAGPETHCEVFGGGADAELREEWGPPSDEILGDIERPKQQWETPPEVEASLARGAAAVQAKRHGPHIQELLERLHFYVERVTGWMDLNNAMCGKRRAMLKTFLVKVLLAVKRSPLLDDVHRMKEANAQDVVDRFEGQVNQITRDFRLITPYLCNETRESSHQRLVQDLEEYFGK